jgi:hypothetical protein
LPTGGLETAIARKIIDSVSSDSAANSMNLANVAAPDGSETEIGKLNVPASVAACR